MIGVPKSLNEGMRIQATNEKIVRLDAVLSQTGLSRRTLYELMGKKQFPKPISISARSVGWLQSEIDAWIGERVAARGSKEAAFDCFPSIYPDSAVYYPCRQPMWADDGASNLLTLTAGISRYLVHFPTDLHQRMPRSRSMAGDSGYVQASRLKAVGRC